MAIISALIKSSANKKAAKTAAAAELQAGQTQAAAADRATALQEKIYQDQRGIYAPTATLGAGALARQSIMAGGDPGAAQQFYGDQTQALNGTRGTDPGLVGYTADSWRSTDPGYAFRLGEGTQALERSAAARGQLFSGATGKALQRYGQDYASNEFMNAFNRLGSIAQSGQGATSAIGGAGQNYGNQATQTIQNAGAAMATGQRNAGNVRASGYAANGNIWGDAVGSTIGAATSMFGGGFKGFGGAGKGGWFG